MNDRRESPDCNGDGWVPCTPGTLHSLKNAPGATNRLTGLKPYATGLFLGILLAVGAVTVKSISVQPEMQPTLTCAEVKPLLIAYAARKLDEHVAAQVREHLSSCAPCQSYFDQLAGNPYQVLLRDIPTRMQLAMVQ